MTFCGCFRLNKKKIYSLPCICDIKLDDNDDVAEAFCEFEVGKTDCCHLSCREAKKSAPSRIAFAGLNIRATPVYQQKKITS